MFMDATPPETEVGLYGRESWKTRVAGVDAEFIVELMALTMSYCSSSRSVKPASRRRLRSSESSTPHRRTNPLSGFRDGTSTPESSFTGSVATDTAILLKEQSQIQVEMLVGGNSQVSPVFRP